MSRRSCWLSCLVLLFSVTAAMGQEVLDLVPEEAAAGLGIRNLGELKKKSDQFTKDAELNVPFVPSQLFEMGFQMLNIQAGVDDNAPVALILANPTKSGHDRVSTNPEDLIVAAVPFTDRDKIAGNFGVTGADLQPNKVVPAKGEPIGKFLYLREKYLFVGNSEKALLSVVNGKSVNTALTPEQRKTFGTADVVLHLGTQAWAEDWKDFLKMVEQELGNKTDKAEQELARQVLESLQSIRFGLGGLRIDKGIGFNMLAVWPEKGNEAARKLLTRLQGGPGASDLKGLPEGRVVFAEAAKGDGAQTELLLRLVVDLLIRDIFEANWLPSAEDRPNFVGVLGEVWKHLQGHRVAVYQNADERAQGLFSVVAILDTGDSTRFLNVLKQLTRLAREELAVSGDKPRKDDVEEVEKLIRDLGDDDYQVRESASTKLGLLGEPALPYIEKALSSEDPEVARRAEMLKNRIVGTAAARRRELLAPEQPLRIRPTFAHGGTETRDGQRIDTLRMKLAGHEEMMKQVFGPNWSNVRLAPHGKQVVVLLGSDEKLLHMTLTNLKEGKAGLAAAATQEDFGKQTNKARKMEFHVSVGTILKLIQGTDLREGKPKGMPALSSVALTISPERLQFDLWVPVAEVRDVTKSQLP